MLNTNSQSSIEEIDSQYEFHFLSLKPFNLENQDQESSYDSNNIYLKKCSNIKDSFEILSDLYKNKGFETIEIGSRKQKQKKQKMEQQNLKSQQAPLDSKQINFMKNISRNFQMIENKINQNDDDDDYDQDDEDLIEFLDIELQDQKKCQYCGKKIKKNILKVHEDQCRYKQNNYDEITCPYCGENVIRDFINDHFEECDLYYEDQFLKLEGIQECSICMSEIKEKKQILSCHHQFHSDCIKDWLEKKMECPVCRKQVFF